MMLEPSQDDATPPEPDWMGRYHRHRRPLAFAYDRELGEPDEPPWYLVVAASLVSVAAIVVWLIGIDGDWGQVGNRDRSSAWAVFGGIALGLLVVSRLRRSREWRLTIGGSALVVSVLLDVAIWHQVGLETFPKAASALSFAGMIGVAVAVGLWAAADLIDSGHHRSSVAVLVAGALLLAGIAPVTAGWSDRSLHLHQAHSPLPSGATPGHPTTKAWTTSYGTEATSLSDGSQLYSVSYGHGRAKVTAITPSTGRTRWTWSRPTNDDVYLAAGSGAAAIEFDGRIAVVDARSGAQRFTVPAPPVDSDYLQGPTDHMSLADGTLVDQAGSGRILAWSLQTGRRLWQALPFAGAIGEPTSQPNFASVAAIDGVIGTLTAPYQLDGSLTTINVNLIDGQGTIRVVRVPGFASSTPEQKYSAAFYRSATLVATDGVLVGSVHGEQDILAGSDPGATRSLVEFGIDPGSGRLLWDHQLTADPDSDLVPEIVPTRDGLLAPSSVGADGAGQYGLLDPRTGRLVRRLPTQPFDSLDINVAGVDDSDYTPHGTGTAESSMSQSIAAAGNTAYFRTQDNSGIDSIQAVDLITGHVVVGPGIGNRNDVALMAALPGAVAIEELVGRGANVNSIQLAGYR